jgi:uncharacterized protein YecT (DUF1311 family)
MIMSKINILFLGIFFSALASSEEKWDFGLPALMACQSGPVNSLDIRLCIDAEYEKSDKELNRVYKKLIESLVNSSDLVHAEIEWIKFRNYSCAFETSALESGSPAQQTMYASCLLHHTKIRINDLKRLTAMTCNGCPERKNP